MLGIYHDLQIKGDIKHILTAVTTPEGFDSWWTNKCSGKKVVGEIFNFHFSADYNWFATMVEFIPNEKVVYDMTMTSPDWEGTSLIFEVKKGSDGIHLLRFEHTGWKELTDNFRVTSYCWANYLNNLKKYIETGVKTPFQPK